MTAFIDMKCLRSRLIYIIASDRYSYGLALYRTLSSSIILFNFIFYSNQAEFFFGTSSVVDFSTYYQIADLSFYGLVKYPFHSQAALYALGPITISACIAYIYGLGGRIPGIWIYYALMTIQTRNPLILDGSDNVILVTFPFVLLGSIALSDVWDPNHVNGHGSFGRRVGGLCAFAIKLQICIVYFFTFLAKIQGKLWLNGTAVYYVMRVRDFVNTKWNFWLTNSALFVTISTYFTLLFEGLFAFLIWDKRYTVIVIAAGIALHFGIYMFMRIDNFSWIMIASYTLFVSNESYLVLQRWLPSLNRSVVRRVRKVEHFKSTV